MGFDPQLRTRPSLALEGTHKGFSNGKHPHSHQPEKQITNNLIENQKSYRFVAGKLPLPFKLCALRLVRGETVSPEEPLDFEKRDPSETASFGLAECSFWGPVIGRGRAGMGIPRKFCPR